ncbi:C1 family peptidase [Actinocatenispora sera]|uniref:Aminopeptidase n=1 Tax=Actinocatenispora sera TaxID=390989 RepID=A0A810L6J7_9ACTN|nr:C1 family peptidase [Actinocatenispora sera]BCJ29931.1 aminopeptidase [Actinocatenispora sera]
MDAGSRNTLGTDELELLRKQFAANPANRVAQNAVAATPVDQVALDRSVGNGIDHAVSHLLDDWKATDQQKSGRCWLFAGLNLLRVGAKRKLNLKDFEFSQNHLMFWDKLERANYFLTAVIETAGADVDDRTVAHLLSHVAEDGGQWNMFVALVAKHGLVPKSAMPETDSSGQTARMNSILQKVLREGAYTLRTAAAAGATEDELDEQRREILTVVYRVLAIHLGNPPERFEWQWTDADRQYHRDGELTPQQFAQRYVELPLADYVCLVHDPRNPTGRTYTVEYLGNVLGGAPVVYLNVDMAVLKDVAAKTITGGEPVWFGCDVAQQFDKKLGVWDAKLLDYPSVYSTTFALSKADRLTYHESAMSHAMLFTGVDIADDGTPRRWRVENSWGTDLGQEGFFTMTDSWFDEYVFEIAARADLLPAELQEALSGEPTVLPAWDPMGALAR